MSPPNESERRALATSNGQGDLATDGQGVLSKLPRTRPQRASARRTAARGAATAATAGARATDPAPAASNGHSAASTPRKAARSTAKRAPAARGAAKTRGAKATKPSVNAEPAPRQGFECESEHTSRAVHPPGGAELVASVAEIFGELAKAGVATGERLLKDALSRLPLS
jgi:hypothetical protein